VVQVAELIRIRAAPSGLPRDGFDDPLQALRAEARLIFCAAPAIWLKPYPDTNYFHANCTTTRLSLIRVDVRNGGLRCSLRHP
jgi:hypothetical protein